MRQRHPALTLHGGVRGAVQSSGGSAAPLATQVAWSTAVQSSGGTTAVASWAGAGLPRGELRSGSVLLPRAVPDFPDLEGSPHI